MNSIIIDCDTCVMRSTAVCTDCLVTHVCEDTHSERSCSTSPSSEPCAGLRRPEWCLRFATVQLPDPEYLATLVALGQRCGLEHIGVAPATVMERARSALQTRKQSGLHDSMQFTYRNPERSTDPGAAVAGARSMIVAARSYVLAEPPTPEPPYAAVARYAWVDHYEPLRFGLQNIVRRLRADGYKAVAFADDNSVVDREAAWLGRARLVRQERQPARCRVRAASSCSAR